MAESIGQILRKAREEQELSLEEISLVTHIKEPYLEAMEADRFEDLPSPVQQKGFLRAYALHLGLDPKPLVSQLTGEDASESEDAPGEVPSREHRAQEEPLPEPSAEQAAAEDHSEESISDQADRQFQGIGESLQSQREQLGLSLTDVENQIHIPIRYLAAIEGGRLEELPSSVQGRGMLKNYAEFLGLDPDILLLRYADVLQQRLREKHPPSSSSRRGLRVPLWIRRVFRGSSLIGMVILLLVGAALVWSAAQVFGGGEGQTGSTETIPGVADVLLPSQTVLATPTLTATPAVPEAAAEGEGPTGPTRTAVEVDPEAGQPTPEIADVQVQLIITQRSFVQVEVDGELAFSGRMLPGSVHAFGGENRIEVTTGNAAGVEVIFNQRDLGVLGVYGQVVNRIFTSEGIATATPTITPTPTVTDTPTLTTTPSPTPLQP
jgi:cytoskeletal protein RodZ